MSTLALAVVGTPEFVVGFFLILVFATQLGWFPAVSLLPVGSGSMFDKPIIMVLPIVAISLIGACTLVRPCAPWSSGRTKRFMSNRPDFLVCRKEG